MDLSAEQVIGFNGLSSLWVNWNLFWRPSSWGGDVPQLVERRTGSPLTQVRLPGAASDFSPSQLSVQSLLSVSTSTCAIACINICAHIKDPVVHVRVRRNMEKLKYQHAPLVAQRDSVRAGFPRRKQPEFTIGEILMGKYSRKKKKKPPRDGTLHGSGKSHATTASPKPPFRDLGGWAMPFRQRKCWMDNIKEWTSLPVLELLAWASCRKDWKRISAESSHMSPR